MFVWQLDGSGGSLSGLDWALRVEIGMFETIDADAVVSIAVVEHERLLAVRQDLVGSLVRRCEGWAVAIAAHKHVGAMCQSGRHKRLSGAVRDRRYQCPVVNCLAESRNEPCCLLGLLPTRYEISRNRQWRSVYQLC